GQLGTVGPRLGRLRRPVERDGDSEDPAHGPLDVRAECGRSRVNVKNAPRGRTVRTGSNACGHCDLLEFRRSRCAFPSVLSSVLKEVSDTYVISGPIVTHVAPVRQPSRRSGPIRTAGAPGSR